MVHYTSSPHKHSHRKEHSRRSKSCERKSKSPCEECRSRSKSCERKSKSPCEERRSHSKLCERRPKSPCDERQYRSKSCERRSKSPCEERRSRSKSCEHRSRSKSCEKEYDVCKLAHFMKRKLLRDKCLMPAGSDAYASIYNVSAQSVRLNNNVLFDSNQLMFNIDHTPGNPEIYIRVPGYYVFTFSINTDQSGQFALFVNNDPHYETICGKNAGAGQIISRCILHFNCNDVLTIRNFYTGSIPVDINTFAGSSTILGTNAEVILFKINTDCVAEKVKPLQWSPALEELEKHRECHDKEDEDDKYKQLIHDKKCLFEKVECKLLQDKSLMLNFSDTFGMFWNTDRQDILLESPILFALHKKGKHIEHVNGTAELKVLKAGVYVMEFCINTIQPCQFSIFINGVLEPTTTAGTNKGAGQLLLRQTLALNENDVVTVVNHQSAIGTITTSLNAGGTLPGVNSSMVLYRIAPLCKDRDKYMLEYPPKEDEDDKCDYNEQFECLYKAFRHYLIHERELQVNGSQGFANTYSTCHQEVKLKNLLVEKYDLNLLRIKHETGTTQHKIYVSGIYKVIINLLVDVPGQFTIFVNGVPLPETTTGVDAGANELTIRAILKLKCGDCVSVANYMSSFGTIPLSRNPGGELIPANAQFVLYKIAPYQCLFEDDKNLKDPKITKPETKLDVKPDVKLK